jgi:hypothetical protein
MATFEQIALFNYTKELMALDVAERFDQICARLEFLEAQLNALREHVIALEVRTAAPPRRGPGRPRKHLNG